MSAGRPRSGDRWPTGSPRARGCREPTPIRLRPFPPNARTASSSSPANESGRPRHGTSSAKRRRGFSGNSASAIASSRTRLPAPTKVCSGAWRTGPASADKAIQARIAVDRVPWVFGATSLPADWIARRNACSAGSNSCERHATAPAAGENIPSGTRRWRSPRWISQPQPTSSRIASRSFELRCSAAQAPRFMRRAGSNLRRGFSVDRPAARHRSRPVSRGDTAGGFPTSLVAIGSRMRGPGSTWHAHTGGRGSAA
jgi:hypothetical protein